MVARNETEVRDHAARALELTEASKRFPAGASDDLIGNTLRVAQVHATLAVRDAIADVLEALRRMDVYG